MLFHLESCSDASHLAFCPSLSQRHTLLSSACSYGSVEMFCGLNSQPKSSWAVVMDQGLLEQGIEDTVNACGIHPLQKLPDFKYRK